MWKYKKARDQLQTKLRYAGRLLTEIHKTLPGVTLEEALKPGNIDLIVEATNTVAKAVSSSGTEPSETAVKIGHVLKACVMRLINKGLQSGVHQLLQESRALEEILRQEWTNRVVKPVKFAIKEKKRKEKIQLPTTSDVMILAAEVKKTLGETTERFLKKKLAHNYRELQKATMARTITFNRKRSTEIASARIVDFVATKEANESSSSEVFSGMKECYRKTVDDHVVMVVNGKCNRNNFTVLDPPLVKAYETLIDNRHVRNLSKNNPHIFALSVPYDSYMSSLTVLKTCVGKTGVKNMATRQMRKYFAMVFQVIITVPTNSLNSSGKYSKYL